MPGTRIQQLPVLPERSDDRQPKRVVPIIKSKLYPPRETAVCVSRGRLISLLEQHAGLTLTLVSAPAGYGKSVLVREWALTQEKPLAWLSLDENDSNLRQFLTCLVASLVAVVPDACPSIKEALAAAELPSVDVLTNLFLNDLESLETPCCIVLDDYHRLQIDSPVQNLVETLLEHPPGDLQLVIVTRRDPPLHLTRLRARGSMVDIRQEDLRFTDSELREFLLKLGGFTVSESATVNLQNELEGWAAGLRLALLNLRNLKDPDQYLKSLRGGLPVVREFLLTETLNSLSVELQRQLIELSVTDRFCTELIDALSEGGSGADFLQFLQEQNLFTVSLDPHNHWFRFHHLFGELLQVRLKELYSAAEIAELHIQVSAWFEAQGLIGDAIRHALRAGNLEFAADVLERFRKSPLTSEGWAEATRYLQLLPVEIIRERPLLMLHQAWIAHEDFRLGSVPAILSAIRELLDRRTDSEAEAELTYLEALENFWAGDGEGALEKLLSAESGSPQNHRLLQGEIALHISLSLQMTGRSDQAHLRIADYRRESEEGDDYVIRSRVDSASVFVHLLCGELSAARFAARYMEAQAVRGNHLYEISWARYLKANANLQSGHLQAALDGFAWVAEKRHALHRKAAMDALSGLTLTSQLLNKPDLAKASLEMLHAYVVDTETLEHQLTADSCSARLALLEGDVKSALLWARSHNAVINSSSTFLWICVPALNQLRVFIASGRKNDLREAEMLLKALVTHASALNNDYLGVQVRVLGALLAEKLGDRAGALDALRGVVEDSRAGGWLMPFIEPGPVVAELLEELHLPPDEELGLRVRDFFEIELRSGADGPTGPLLAVPSKVLPAGIDGLTNRELEILGLLAERLQNKEIAGRLVISIHTVNDHIKHIYQKLGVGNRRHAVRTATELGLISYR